MGEGEYNARVTELAAQTQTVQQMPTASQARAGELPADVLENNSINVTASQTLEQDAENLNSRSSTVSVPDL